MNADVFKPVEPVSSSSWPHELIQKAPEKLKAALLERERLIGLLFAADKEHRALLTDSSIAAAVKKDSDALAIAMASGRTDPGDKAFAKLTEEITKAKRKSHGFNLALAAQNSVVDELLASDLGDEFREILASSRRELMAELESTITRLKSLTDSIDVIDGERDFVGAHVSIRRKEPFEDSYGRTLYNPPMGNPRRTPRATLNELPAEFVLDSLLNVYRGAAPLLISTFRGEADINALNTVNPTPIVKPIPRTSNGFEVGPNVVVNR